MNRIRHFKCLFVLLFIFAVLQISCYAATEQVPAEQDLILAADTECMLHIWVIDPAIPASCVEAGKTEGSHCSQCGFVQLAQTEIPPLSHIKQIDPAVPAGCTLPGLTEGVHCSSCTTVLIAQQEVPATGHSYSEEETFEASCAEAACTLKTCVTCGEQQKEYFGEPLPHDYARMTIQPTCTDGGYTLYECTKCGTQNNADETEALGHDVGSMTIQPTCTDGGYTLVECYRCGYSVTENEQSPFGHDFRHEKTVTANCEQEGYKLSVCSRCGTKKKNNETPAIGHNYVAGNTVSVNCTRSGYTLYECTNCGNSIIGDVITTPGHLYSTYLPWDEGNHISVCDRSDCSASIMVECTIYSFEIAGTVVHYCPICGLTDADDSLLRIIDNACAVSLDSRVPSGTLILRHGTINGDMDILCIVFEQDGKAESTDGCIRISVPAETVKNAKLVEIDINGVENELNYSRNGGMISFELDFGSTGGSGLKPAKLIRLVAE